MWKRTSATPLPCPERPTLIQFGVNVFAADWGSGRQNASMKQNDPDHIRQRTVCGQAQTVLDNLARSRSLPRDLSLTIEEILERAWEIAYRRRVDGRAGNVIVLRHWRGRPAREEGLETFNRPGHRIDI